MIDDADAQAERLRRYLKSHAATQRAEAERMLPAWLKERSPGALNARPLLLTLYGKRIARLLLDGAAYGRVDVTPNLAEAIEQAARRGELDDVTSRGEAIIATRIDDGEIIEEVIEVADLLTARRFRGRWMLADGRELQLDLADPDPSVSA